jgi:hypothetical protein
MRALRKAESLRPFGWMPFLPIARFQSAMRRADFEFQGGLASAAAVFKAFTS